MRVLVWGLVLMSLAVAGTAYACPMHGDKHPVIAGAEAATPPQTPAPVRLPGNSKS
ncbi:hypothetical protein HRbin40_02615 [bacterium HR40]|nr:hypothetical protein HRbin40_02615 [bacterium HR40]